MLFKYIVSPLSLHCILYFHLNMLHSGYFLLIFHLANCLFFLYTFDFCYLITPVSYIIGYLNMLVFVVILFKEAYLCMRIIYVYYLGKDVYHDFMLTWLVFAEIFSDLCWKCMPPKWACICFCQAPGGPGSYELPL